LITLPQGWKARLPKGVHARSVFGEFDSEYAQDGRVVALRRKMVGARGVYPPQRIGELTAWMRAMAQEDTRFVVIDPGVGSSASGGR
jgi:hypothetical protein